MINRILFALLCLMPFAGHAQDDKEKQDLERRWRASMEAAEEKQQAERHPKVTITGVHYVDSEYGIGFYFNSGDSIQNKSANGVAYITISNGFYYMRMNSVKYNSAVESYAKEVHERAKNLTPKSATHYKVGKLRKGENEYCLCWHYETHYTDPDGKDMMMVTRIQYGTMGKALVLVAVFPDDAEVEKKTMKLNDLANSVSMF